jgi:uncharacterized protein YecE (DUF72 family)
MQREELPIQEDHSQCEVSYPRMVKGLGSMVIVVGCCGFAIPGGMKGYYKEFDLVEIQSTFYNIPHLETVDRWRQEASPGFEFVPKAFQGITHPTSSPTWRRFRGRLPGGEKESPKYGFLKPTDEVIDCWNTTIEICQRLRAEAVLIQTPPNFGASKSNILNMKRLLTGVKRRGIVVCWEPRGEWNENPSKIESVCSELDLVHVVDLMRREPVSTHEVSYTRLHGLNPREFDYRYKYSDAELLLLKDKILKLDEKGKKVYVLFNNTNMATDAKRLKEMISRKDR